MNCIFCNYIFDDNREPRVEFHSKEICYPCTVILIEKIYYRGGDGGLSHLIFKDLLTDGFNRKRRRSLKRDKVLFNKLLYKYKFSCVTCGEENTEVLTVDHIKPVSKGGGDNYLNLQILCKSCNSRKGNRYG